MIDANDFGAVPESGCYPFGVAVARSASALHRFAADVAEGRVALQTVETRTIATCESGGDWVKKTLTLTYIEPVTTEVSASG